MRCKGVQRAPVCYLSQRFSKWLGLAGGTWSSGVACAKNCRILVDVAGFRVKEEFPTGSVQCASRQFSESQRLVDPKDQQAGEHILLAHSSWSRFSSRLYRYAGTVNSSYSSFLDRAGKVMLELVIW